jgi:hypothetical protein
MKTNLKFGLVAVLAISLLALGMSTVNATENSTNPSDTFVHPGVGFEDIEKSNEYFVDAYGILPEFKSEGEKQEFISNVEKVSQSVTDDLYTKNQQIKKHLDGETPITADKMLKTANENDIDISNNLVKFGGDPIVALYFKDGYIVVGWNIYLNSDSRAKTLDDILKDENLTLSEFIDNIIDRETMDEIYGVYYQRGKEIGIKDVPVVFELGAPLIPLTDVNDTQTDPEAPAHINNEVTINKTLSLGFASVIFVLALAFMISRKMSKE